MKWRSWRYRCQAKGGKRENAEQAGSPSRQRGGEKSAEADKSEATREKGDVSDTGIGQDAAEKGKSADSA